MGRGEPDGRAAGRRRTDRGLTVFAAGFSILLLWLLLTLKRPLIMKASWIGGLMLATAIGLLLMSLVVLAWRWLP